MIARPPCSITNKERLLLIHADNVEVVIILKLMPHPRPRLPVFRIGGGRIDTERNIEITHQRCDFLLEDTQAFGFALAALHVLLDADPLLVGEDDHLEADLVSH